MSSADKESSDPASFNFIWCVVLFEKIETLLIELKNCNLSILRTLGFSLGITAS